MQNEKVVKDIMVKIMDYPHIPFWFSVGKAIRIAKVFFRNVKRYTDPLLILVFDDKYQLVGTISIQDILKGLEPGLGKVGQMAESIADAQLPPYIDALFGGEAVARSDMAVGEIMQPVRFFVEPLDAVKKAAYIMLRNDLTMLPVLVEKTKLVGLVRIVDVFDEIAKGMIKE